MPEFHCPLCETHIEYAPHDAGRIVPCPHCKERVRIPGSAPPSTDARRRVSLAFIAPEADGTLPAARRIGVFTAIFAWLWIASGILVAGSVIIALATKRPAFTILSSLLCFILAAYFIVVGILLLAYRNWFVGVTAIWQRIMVAVERE